MQNQITNDNRLHYLLLAVCVVTGCLLRFWNPSELAFINDELSTWQKVSFDSIGAVIENIKVDDSHPVGMYVFLYFWTSIFGTSVWAFKLPFALMSIASIYLVYQIARKWFSPNTALLATAYFCTLQFPIWWSAIARQYQSGLFLTLGMAYCWTSLLVEKKPNKKYWTGFILFGAAAMYNHYFSLIFAAVIGISGLWWINRSQLFKYLGAGVAMTLLFAPHIPITLYQLQNATGHTWYPVPKPSFFAEVFNYIFHFSPIVWGLALLLSVFTFVQYRSETVGNKWKIRLTALFWFWAPLFFGYFYSVYKAPILRESHLLFSFPYLLLFLFSFAGTTKVGFKWQPIAVILVLIANSWTLCSGRKHFQTMNSHPYRPFIENTGSFLAQHTPDSTEVVLGENPLYLQYYKKAYSYNFEHTPSFKPNISLVEFSRIVRESKKPYLILGSLPESHVQIALDYYPIVLKYQYGINYEYYILSKQAAKASNMLIDSTITVSFNDEQNRKGWNWRKDWIQIDTTNINFHYQMPEGSEWGPTFEAPLRELTQSRQTFIDIAINVRTDSLPPNGVIVVELQDDKGSNIAWQGHEIKHQITTVTKEWQTIYLSLRLSHWLKDVSEIEKTTFKTYYWNKEKQAVALDEMRVQLRQGNPILYKDTNDFDE